MIVENCICIICDAAIDVDNDSVFTLAEEEGPVFSMDGQGPYCGLCWMEKKERGGNIIMDTLNRCLQELKERKEDG